MSQEYYIIREETYAPTDREARAAAIHSKNTVGAAAACACGIKIDSFSRQIEDTPQGPKSIATFALENSTVEFLPQFSAEKISTGELLRRVQDERWIEENPHHPIAYMAVYAEVSKKLTRMIREVEPSLTIRRGKSTLHLSRGGDRERQARLLDRAGFSEAEIEEILAEVHK
jgi:hypothetical protein